MLRPKADFKDHSGAMPGAACRRTLGLPTFLPRRPVPQPQACRTAQHLESPSHLTARAEGTVASKSLGFSPSRSGSTSILWKPQFSPWTLGNKARGQHLAAPCLICAVHAGQSPLSAPLLPRRGPGGEGREKTAVCSSCPRGGGEGPATTPSHSWARQGRYGGGGRAAEWGGCAQGMLTLPRARAGDSGEKRGAPGTGNL